MNKLLIIVLGIVLVGGAIFVINKINNMPDNILQDDSKQAATTASDVQIYPISHATMVLKWADKVIYTDPVGGAGAFAEQPKPNIIMITDIHPDHFEIPTLSAVSTANTIIIAPPAVASQIPESVAGTVVALANNATTKQGSFTIQAIPMYNVPESAQSFHPKGRGNGYVLEASGKRVYLSGDSGNTEEMRALQNIDIAFVAMNLPYTMTVDDAAQAVLAFKPKQVIPYHYRGQEGFSDTARFKQLVNDGNPDIMVNLFNFYPES